MTTFHLKRFTNSLNPNPTVNSHESPIPLSQEKPLNSTVGLPDVNGIGISVHGDPSHPAFRRRPAFFTDLVCFDSLHKSFGCKSVGLSVWIEGAQCSTAGFRFRFPGVVWLRAQAQKEFWAFVIKLGSGTKKPSNHKLLVQKCVYVRVYVCMYVCMYVRTYLRT